MTATGFDPIQRFFHLASLFHELPRPPFHVFRFEGKPLLYHTVHCAVLRISSAVLEVLQEIELSSPNVRAITPREVSSDWLDRLGREPSLLDALLILEDLARNGLFALDELYGVDGIEEMAQRLIRQPPRNVMLLVHTGCNLACTYCYERLSPLMGKKMNTENARAAVDSLVARSGQRSPIKITFFGGEPTLSFDTIREVVSYCKELEKQGVKEFVYSITTNGTLLTDEMIEFFVEHKFSGMASVDGPPELNDMHRVDHGGMGHGEEVMENFQRLIAAQKEAGLRPFSIRATMSKQNHDKLGLWDYFEGLGFERISLGAALGSACDRKPWDMTEEDWHEIDSAEAEIRSKLLEALKNGRDIPAIARTKVLAVREFHQGLGRPVFPGLMCGVGRNMLANTPDGKLYPCHRFAGMAQFELGDGHTLDPEKMAKFYDAVFRTHREHCATCWARSTCDGKCSHYLAQQDGTISPPDKEFCDVTRKGLEETMWLYVTLKEKYPRFFERLVGEEQPSNGTFVDESELSRTLLVARSESSAAGAR